MTLVVLYSPQLAVNRKNEISILQIATHETYRESTDERGNIHLWALTWLNPLQLGGGILILIHSRALVRHLRSHGRSAAIQRMNIWFMAYLVHPWTVMEKWTSCSSWIASASKRQWMTLLLTLLIDRSKEILKGVISVTISAYLTSLLLYLLTYFTLSTPLLMSTHTLAINIIRMSVFGQYSA